MRVVGDVYMCVERGERGDLVPPTDIVVLLPTHEIVWRIPVHPTQASVIDRVI